MMSCDGEKKEVFARVQKNKKKTKHWLIRPKEIEWKKKWTGDNCKKQVSHDSYSYNI